MSATERPADRPPHDGISHAEPWFDLHGVTHDAAIGSIEQCAFVPPDTVIPTRRRFAVAVLVRQGHHLNPVAVDWDDSEEQLPMDWSANPPRLGVEGRTVR